jgi:hypothetical protein
MDTSAKTITTMGIISNEVYNTTPGKDYFSTYPDDMVVNGTTYKVIDHTDDSSWLTFGFEALLLQKEGTNEYVVAFRGTEPASALDWINDILVETSNINIQYSAALAFVQKALKNSNININNLTLTGHSLGGMLTQQVGGALGIEGYAFNPFGMENLLTYLPGGNLAASIATALYNMMSSVGLGSVEVAWAKDHILNVSYNDFGLLNGDPLSNFASEFTSHDFLGTYLPVFGKNEGFLGGHSMPILNTAIQHYKAVLSHFADRNDFISLSKAYVSVGSYEKTEKIFSDAGVYDKTITGLSFNFLQNATASYIATQAKSDPAVLYALAKLNPFAIEGDLPAYANLNRTDMSKQYIEDRAQYLYYLLDKTNRYDVDPTLSMTWYEDAALGSDYTLEQTFSRSRVLFGGEGKSTLTGGDNGDHLYGMGGDDTLTGNGGDDYMEGGIGYDTYYSGNGDTIKDSDGSGKVAFEGKLLHGGVAQEGECKPDGSGEYKGDGGVYKLSGGKLTFTKDGTGEILTIEKFYNGDLGISLTSKDPGASCPPPMPV